MSDIILRSQVHKARFDHVCKICERPIQKGSKYENTVGVESEVFFSVRNHIQCVKDRSEYLNDQKRKEGCGEWAQDEF
tara:strand:+ start:8424 stop:8657 length:234 start_codon:yes stop_codon:yes gene_type:complete